MPTTFEKPWFLDPNRPHPAGSTSVLDQGKAQLWYWKAFLKGDVGGATLGLWTVIGSSDGVTAALDGIDRWIGAGGPAVYDGTKINRGLQGYSNPPATTAATTGGTLATGTYYFAVFPVNDNGILGNPYYEKSQAVTGPTGTVTVTWVASAGQTVTSWRVYVGTASNGENTYFTVPAGPLTFTYTGQAGTAGTLPVTVFSNATPPVNYLTSSAPHSWITLKSPGITAGGITNTPFYLTYAYGPGSIGEHAVNVYFSKTQPTGGSIYSRPTAPDDLGWGQIQFVNSAAGASPKLNGWLAADGTFAFGSVNPGANQLQGGFAFVPLADARPDDLFPVAVFLNWSSSGAYAAVKSSNIWAIRNKDNTAGVFCSMAWLTGYVDPVASFPNTGDQGDLGFYELATYIITAAAPLSIRGRVADLVAAVPGIAGVQGYTEPAGGPPASEILGYLWFPLPGGVAVTL